MKVGSAGASRLHGVQYAKLLLDVLRNARDLREMSDLNFTSGVPAFDANVGVGHRNDRRYPYDGPQQLLDEMARHGVDRALVYACHGEVISPIHGNDTLDRWSNGENGLVPQYVVGADSESLKQVQDLHASGLVTSVRLHNTSASRLPFVAWVYGDLLEWLAGVRLPLWVSIADTPPTEVVETLQRYPNIPVVLVGAHYTHSMLIRPMLRALPNAFLELSRYENVRGVERLIGEIGAERTMYGSYFPRYAMGPMLYMLNHLAIGEDDLAGICAGNLEKLLSVTSDQ